jgi:hypothetical protein
MSKNLNPCKKRYVKFIIGIKAKDKRLKVMVLNFGLKLKNIGM